MCRWKPSVPYGNSSIWSQLGLQTWLQLLIYGDERPDVGVSCASPAGKHAPQVLHEVAVVGVETPTVNVCLHDRVDEKRLQSVCLTHRLHVPWIPTVRWKHLETHQCLMSRTWWQISSRYASAGLGHYIPFTLISAHHWQLFESYISPLRCCMRIAYQVVVSRDDTHCSFGTALSSVSLHANRTPRSPLVLATPHGFL